MKVCLNKKCEQTNPQNFKSFHKNRTTIDGFHKWCKFCRKQESLDYVTKNKEKIKEYIISNKEKIKVIQRNYREKHKDTLDAKSKKWKENNKDKHRQNQREYFNKRKKLDINFKLSSRLRTRLWNALKNNQKIGSAIKDLGCTLTELKKYLQNKFQFGMNWENYGEWHIDHIKPLSLFNLTNREEFLKACHYTNLQPLWARDNLIKGNNYEN